MDVLECWSNVEWLSKSLSALLYLATLWREKVNGAQFEVEGRRFVGIALNCVELWPRGNSLEQFALVTINCETFVTFLLSFYVSSLLAF